MTPKSVKKRGGTPRFFAEKKAENYAGRCRGAHPRRATENLQRSSMAATAAGRKTIVRLTYSRVACRGSVFGAAFAK